MRAPVASLLLSFSMTAAAADVKSLSVSKSDGFYLVDMIAYVEAPVANVYDVLVDFDNLDRLSGAIVESRYLEPADDGSPLVYTLTRKCIFFFCGKIEKVDRLELELNRSIIAVALPERSNVVHALSAWRLSGQGHGTLLEFRQELDPDFWVPPIIGSIMIKRMLRRSSRRAIVRVEYYARVAAGMDADEPPPIKRKRRPVDE